jgi:hypothetical protein
MGQESVPDSARWARWVALAAALGYLICLLLLRWWPPDFVNPRFLSYREALLEDASVRGNYPGLWTFVPVSFYRFGFLIALGAFFVMPWTLCAHGRRHWMVGLTAMLATAWHGFAVVSFGLINTTAAPYGALFSAVLSVGCWICARIALDSERARVLASHSYNG